MAKCFNLYDTDVRISRKNSVNTMGIESFALYIAR